MAAAAGTSSVATATAAGAAPVPASAAAAGPIGGTGTASSTTTTSATATATATTTTSSNINNLVDACMHNKYRTAAELLAAGTNPNDFDERGFTPLLMCATHGHRKIARLLIKHGADVNQPEADLLITPLHVAAKECQVDFVYMLVNRYNANLSALDVCGRTVMHWAAIGANMEIINYLLSLKVKFDLPDLSGYTPVMIAAEHNYMEVATTLLKAGANPASQNLLQHSAVDVCDWYGQRDMIALFKQFLEAQTTAAVPVSQSRTEVASLQATVAEDAGSASEVVGGSDDQS